MKTMTETEMKQCALNALLYFDSICRDRGIKYWLCAGTLLGAVRHKGFIPWDDDIDVMMPREDYNRLCFEFPNNGRYQFLHSGNTKNFPYAFGKVSDTLTVKEEPLRSKYLKIGIDVDVFPIDNFPSDAKEADRLCHDIEIEQRKLQLLITKCSTGRDLFRTFARKLIKAFWFISDDLGFISIDKYISRIQAMSQHFNRNETGFCGVITLAHYGTKEMNEKSIYESSVDVEFEGHLFPAPVRYHAYLSNLYGDYMQLPPEDQRITHHSFNAYWK